uniref:RNA methyltransferase n=1 Tax=Roseihalotalea indica TaxID=2867963 RepID=A0AA49GTI6_9BACT|nr:RNA methyltransferase [Tunicatimonas sp. TK19036]
MVTKKMLKLAKSLHQKKYRHQEQLFLVEGNKSIVELLASSFTVKTLIGTSLFIEQHKSLIEERLSDLNVFQTNETTVSSISSFKNNNAGVALVEIPKRKSPPEEIDGYALVLDDIRDPGNLGTIIRVADWYGIRCIISSLNTTDEYNPKVISASMGSFLRVPLYRADLSSYLSQTSLPVYGTLLDKGDSVYQADFAPRGFIVLGNESEGMRPDTIQYIKQAIHIPEFGEAESLNVGVAAAVVCDNMRRKLEEKNATHEE